MKLACNKCGGEFSKDMVIEQVGGKPHHAYCASVVLKRQREDEAQASTGLTSFFQFWRAFLTP